MFLYCWKYNFISKDECKNVIDEINILVNRLDYKLVLNNNEPQLNTDEIIFNGINYDTNHNNSCFHINFDIPSENHIYTNENDKYDLMIKLILLSLANNIDTFCIYTNTQITNWLSAFNIYSEYIAPLQLNFNQLKSLY